MLPSEGSTLGFLGSWLPSEGSTLGFSGSWLGIEGSRLSFAGSNLGKVSLTGYWPGARLQKSFSDFCSLRWTTPL
jgi:hypothetical protein